MQRVLPRWGILRIFAAWPVFADKAIVNVEGGEGGGKKVNLTQFNWSL